jgi:hypothetical protein
MPPELPILFPKAVSSEQKKQEFSSLQWNSLKECQILGGSCHVWV